MKIHIIPIRTEKRTKQNHDHGGFVFLQRGTTTPAQLFMRHTKVMSFATEAKVGICGDLVEHQSFDQLQDGDILFVGSHVRESVVPCTITMCANEGLLYPIKTNMDTLSIAAAIERGPQLFFFTSELESLMTRAMDVAEKVSGLYYYQPQYKHIMMKSCDGITAHSLVELASKQAPHLHENLIALFLTMSKSTISSSSNSLMVTANRILETCEFNDSFSLLTQEEQVGTFIEFSKLTAAKKREFVPDTVIEQIEQSAEYQLVKERLHENDLRLSQTQQFNVFQSVGFFSRYGRTSKDILYNLSDMGAGKTLMTVEAIYMLDLKQISTWEVTKIDLPDTIKVDTFYVPDKHIIAPTLSIKSSWIETFRLFYEVEMIDEMTYQLSVTHNGITAISTIYVSSFAVRNGNVFVSRKLPETKHNSYLIIDEIHQLVLRNIAKTKFFPPKVVPCAGYQIFILSGTMSNLKTTEWYNYMRFIGLPVTDSTPAVAKSTTEQLQAARAMAIQDASVSLRSEQHRYFDSEPITRDNYYNHMVTKKQTTIEQEFFAKYSPQILNVYHPTSGIPLDVEAYLKTLNTHALVSDPTEYDSINFELFYSVVGSRAITAQSMQVAEELFGKQKKQHVSDIIKTVSPLSKADVQILKTLHHIAENHMAYKSVSISKAINNAILNLNDGLQTKNIYEVISKYAETNTRFFTYLASLDVNILEQLPASGLIQMPDLKDTDKFKVLQDILAREKDETHLIVVNDFYALKSLSEALGITHITKEQLKRELDYQTTLDELFEKQSVVIVTQSMIKSSLDLVQANRLIQYQLNTEISDIIQTQNRINRIGQTRETRGYYIASDQLQENLIKLFIESYRNIRVAHKGIVELFADITSQINIVNDYLDHAFAAIEQEELDEPTVLMDETETELEDVETTGDLLVCNAIPETACVVEQNGISKAILWPQNKTVLVLVPLDTGSAFPIGQLRPDKLGDTPITAPIQVLWNLTTNTIKEV